MECPNKSIADLARTILTAAVEGPRAALPKALMPCIHKFKLFLVELGKATGDPMAMAYSNFVVECRGNLCFMPAAVLEAAEYVAVHYAKS
ncbi:hypothetical protein TTSV1_gp06 [Thermoproteus tenax spherical virus 1]|uniref:Uncharacterized protein n=1 Tax=Thermoproteus tenax spherical virus 1 TaxID=292639 RepID=Q647F6_9VIRU|nr:hypothetical protein TTSV1_gp06 [Thermoproteus tenax spherical virus 1]AAU25956.1 hypothetical protein [Thermoproteus tenax spherical virus 1]